MIQQLLLHKKYRYKSKPLAYCLLQTNLMEQLIFKGTKSLKNSVVYGNYFNNWICKLPSVYRLWTGNEIIKWMSVTGEKYKIICQKDFK